MIMKMLSTDSLTNFGWLKYQSYWFVFLLCSYIHHHLNLSVLNFSYFYCLVSPYLIILRLHYISSTPVNPPCIITVFFSQLMASAVSWNNFPITYLSWLIHLAQFMLHLFCKGFSKHVMCLPSHRIPYVIHWQRLPHKGTVTHLFMDKATLTCQQDCDTPVTRDQLQDSVYPTTT